MTRPQSKFSKWFESGANSSKRLLPMEGLRGVAVTLVFFVHYCTLVEPYVEGAAKPIAAGLYVVGNAGVDLFFVLSGYLIYGSLIYKPQPFIGFMVRRVQRLYPAFIVLLATYVALSFIVPSESKLPSGGWEATLYILANFLLLPGIFDIKPIITVAWTLSYEMFFYVMVPLLVAMLRLRLWKPEVRISVFLATAIVWDALSLPYLRMGMFVCGMLLAEALPIFRTHLRRDLPLDLLAGAATLICGFIMIQDALRAWSFSALFITCFLLCAAAFVHDGPLAKILMFRPLRWLGNMSYSYYLVHGLVLKVIFFVLAHIPAVHHLNEWAFWVLLPPAFMLTIVGSMLLFLTIERPFSIMPIERLRKKPVTDQYSTSAAI